MRITFSLSVSLSAALMVSLSPMVCGHSANAQGAPSSAVPFVGCPADGQGGPVTAPTSGKAPTVPASADGRLAYYSAKIFAYSVGVLAPRGWHCVALYGSSGDTLLVTPDTHRASDFLSPQPIRPKGPIVELSLMNGGTSGRFTVAAIAARIFPAFKAYVQGVIDEGLVSKDEFPFGPYRGDRLTRLSDTEVEFETSANSEGLGTYRSVATSGEPIRGVAILLPTSDMELVLLAVRLEPDMRGLTETIVTEVEKYKRSPSPDLTK